MNYFAPCRSSANVPVHFLAFAEVRQVCRSPFSLSQAPCEAVKVRFLSRGGSARLPKLIFLLAELPRGPKTALACLRNSREPPEASFHARGGSARLPTPSGTFAEVPRAIQVEVVSFLPPKSVSYCCSLISFL